MTSILGSRRGPDLPYDVVAGVKPCATGWLVAAGKVHGTTFAPEEPQVYERFADVLDERPTFSVIAVNAPIGYLETAVPGGRVCDREARALVGRRGGAAIPSAPIRSQVDEGADPSQAGLSAVVRQLMPRYREVAAEMAPYRQRTVFEVTSELCFFQLNDDSPMHRPKRSKEGQEERRALLERRVQGVGRICDGVFPRVPYTHLLDVAAFMWAARRILARAALRVPEDPQWDEEGLRMELLR